MAKIIPILNSKGGAGKSTLATNLSRGFQLKGKRVLIADIDQMQGTARDWRGVEHEIIEYPSVLGFNPATLEHELKAVQSSFDIIIVDGAAKLAATAMVPAIKMADLILIPVQPSGPDVWATRDLVELIVARREVSNGKPDAFFVLSRKSDRTILSRDIEQVLEDFGLPKLDTGTHDWEAYKQAITDGETVFELKEGDKARKEMNDLLQEVIGILDGKK